MQIQATSDNQTAPWRSREAAWAEVRRIVNDDPIAGDLDAALAIHVLEQLEPVWSKEGAGAFLQLLRELQRIQGLVEELGPTVSRLKRASATFSAASAAVGEKMSPHAAGLAADLGQGIAGFVHVFGLLERRTGQVAEWYLPTKGGVREQPTNLVEALERIAVAHPPLRRLLTARGLALYEIATGRDGPCTSEHEFTDRREERWKKNLARARPGT